MRRLCSGSSAGRARAAPPARALPPAARARAQGAEERPGAEERHTFDAVVVAVGNYAEPNLPGGVAGLGGGHVRELHCHNFRSPAAFRGQRVLVAGASFSGARRLFRRLHTPQDCRQWPLTQLRRAQPWASPSQARAASRGACRNLKSVAASGPCCGQSMLSGGRLFLRCALCVRLAKKST